MSKPVTNLEIEDVLSSVKRLVSAGTKAKSDPAPEQSEAPKHPEKFLLTPALRVGGPDDIVESDDDVWTTEIADTVEDETTFVVAQDAEIIEETGRDSLEATIAELEAAVTAQSDEWEPDGSEVNTVPTWETASYPALDDIEDAVAVDAPVEENEGETSTGFGDPFVLVMPEPLVDEASEEEFAQLHTNPNYIPLHAVPELNDEPDDDTSEETSDLSDTEEDQQDADVYGDELAPDTPLVAAPDEDLDTYVFGEGTTITEEMLRQVVMDIVREELRGKMGERITHNVRKMVRREIHRVVNSQDFD